MTSEPAPDDDPARAADDLDSVRSWRRTGLVLGWGAVGCAGAAMLTWLPDRDGAGALLGVLAVVAVVAALLAPAFLRRAWSVPASADDPDAVRGRGCSDAVMVAVATWIVLRFVLDDLLDVGGSWLTVLRGLLGAVLVVGYLAMLVFAVRWRPAPSGQL